MNEKALRAGCALRREEVCCKQHRPGAKESQVLLFTRNSQVTLCPCAAKSRNCGTFAAVSLASAFLNASDIMMVTVSDLIIEDGSYKDSVIKAKEIAKNGAK